MGILFEDFLKTTGVDAAEADRVKGIINDSKYRFLLGRDSNGNTTVDGNVEAIADFVMKSLEDEKKQKVEEHERQVANREFIKNADSLMITTGQSFEGYEIVEYGGCLSADAVTAVQRQLTHLSNIGVERGKTKTAVKLVESLQSLRQEALAELKTEAAGCGCNAIIGVSYSYITLDPLANPYGATGNSQPYIFCVTATGTAVKIKRKREK